MVYDYGTGHSLHKLWMGASVEWNMDHFYFWLKEKNIGNFCEKSVSGTCTSWILTKNQFSQWIILLSLNLTRIWVVYSRVHSPRGNSDCTEYSYMMLELCESSWCHFEVTALMSFISCQSSCTDTDNAKDIYSCLKAIIRTTSAT